jgi:dihydrofolate reductase
LDGRVDDLREWAVGYDDEEAVAYHTELLAHSDALLLGRKTYEIFAATWPALSGRLSYVDQLNSMDKYVASNTLKNLDWNNSQLIEGDVAAAVAALKQRPGQDLVMYGCRDLMHALQTHDLIDEYRILVHPVLLGTGRSFLGEGAKRVNLTLVDAKVTPPGLAVLTYEPAR